jgi:CheY-like chemotaxis protein
VLISDIGMPDEDGYALIRQVRARTGNRGGNTPAIALTGYGNPEDRARLLSAGFQVHLRKPVEPADIVAAVAALASIGGK